MVPVHTGRHSTIIIWNFILQWHPGLTLFRCSLYAFKTCSSEQSNVSTNISAIVHLSFENEKEEIWFKISINSLSSQPCSLRSYSIVFISVFWKPVKILPLCSWEWEVQQICGCGDYWNDPSFLAWFFPFWCIFKTRWTVPSLSDFSSKVLKSPKFEYLGYRWVSSIIHIRPVSFWTHNCICIQEVKLPLLSSFSIQCCKFWGIIYKLNYLSQLHILQNH